MSERIDMDKIIRDRDLRSRNAAKATSADYESRGSQMAYQALMLREEDLDAAADAYDVEADAWEEAERPDLAEAARWSAVRARQDAEGKRRDDAARARAMREP